MEYILPDNVYQILKWVGLIALPAVAVFSQTVLPVCGVDAAITDAVVTILNSAGTLVGALICVSAVTGKPVEQ